MVAIDAAEVRAIIGEFGANATLRRGATSCTVLAAILTPASGGNPAKPNSMIKQDARRAYIAAVDAAGAAITIAPDFGDRLERGAAVFGIGKVRMVNPDGAAIAYVAELQG